MAKRWPKALLATLLRRQRQLQLGVLVRRVQRQPGCGAAAAVTAAWQDGVYRRDFQNGIHAGQSARHGTQTVTLAGTFHKILGARDPAPTTVRPVTSVTLKAADDLVLTR